MSDFRIIENEDGTAYRRVVEVDFRNPLTLAQRCHAFQLVGGSLNAKYINILLVNVREVAINITSRTLRYEFETTANLGHSEEVRKLLGNDLILDRHAQLMYYIAAVVDSYYEIEDAIFLPFFREMIDLPAMLERDGFGDLTI